MAEQLGVLGGDGEGRDVVQPRRKRQYRPVKLPRHSEFLEEVQRYRPLQAKWTGPCPPQHGDVPDGPERMGDVPGKRADIGPLGHRCGKGQFG